jgi:hypothetical protein
VAPTATVDDQIQHQIRAADLQPGVR